MHISEHVCWCWEVDVKNSKNYQVLISWLVKVMEGVNQMLKECSLTLDDTVFWSLPLLKPTDMLVPGYMAPGQQSGLVDLPEVYLPSLHWQYPSSFFPEPTPLPCESDSDLSKPITAIPFPQEGSWRLRQVAQFWPKGCGRKSAGRFLWGLLILSKRCTRRNGLGSGLWCARMQCLGW